MHDLVAARDVRQSQHVVPAHAVEVRDEVCGVISDLAVVINRVPTNDGNQKIRETKILCGVRTGRALKRGEHDPLRSSMLRLCHVRG